VCACAPFFSTPLGVLDVVLAIEPDRDSHDAKECSMPSRDYPRHLVTPIGVSAFVLHARGSNLQLKRQEFPDPESTRFELVSFGELVPDQVSAIVFHLLEWGSDLDEEQIQAISFAGRPLRPHFTTPSCWYDY